MAQYFPAALVVLGSVAALAAYYSRRGLPGPDRVCLEMIGVADHKRWIDVSLGLLVAAGGVAAAAGVL